MDHNECFGKAHNDVLADAALMRLLFRKSNSDHFMTVFATSSRSMVIDMGQADSGRL
jgi:hypothetical protein